LGAVGRVIRARQEERMICTSVAEPKFNIVQDVRFAGVRVAADQATHRSATIGVFSLTCFYTSTMLYVYTSNLLTFFYTTALLHAFSCFASCFHVIKV
jgi:hypothetical protein